MLGVFQNIMNIKKDDVKTELQEKITEIRIKMEIADNLFSNLSNPDLIDACVYEKKSLLSRYNYLLKLARKEEEKSEEKDKRGKVKPA